MHELREDTYPENKDEDVTITLIGSSTSSAYSIFLESLKTQSCSEFFPLPLPEPTTSRNIGSSSSHDGLAALVNKLDNLGRDIKKLKESVHAIQIGCQFCEGPHLEKDCPFNEEVKQAEEVRYGEFRRTTPFNENNEGKFHVGPPGYYTKTNNHLPYGERR
ncbi:hypothetical protein Tco_0324083 [Tanacetum coccineum]